jgi:hypothetical protein
MRIHRLDGGPMGALAAERLEEQGAVREYVNSATGDINAE